MGRGIFNGTGQKTLMNGENFLPFSDAVMAAFASRSHEWMFWEIRECQRAEDPGAPIQVLISLSLPGIGEGAQLRNGQRLCDPQKESPSECVSQVIRAAISGKRSAVPPLKTIRVRDSRGISLPQQATP